MSKKIRVLVAILVAVVLLAVGGVATVLAQEEPAPTTEAAPLGLFDRAAAILGISPEALTSAFKQAQQEMRDEAFTKALDKAVASDRITQEEADALKQWWQQKPDISAPGIFPGGRFGSGFPGGHRGGRMRGEHKDYQPDDTTSQTAA